MLIDDLITVLESNSLRCSHGLSECFLALSKRFLVLLALLTNSAILLINEIPSLFIEVWAVAQHITDLSQTLVNLTRL